MEADGDDSINHKWHWLMTHLLLVVHHKTGLNWDLVRRCNFAVNSRITSYTSHHFMILNTLNLNYLKS